MNCKVMGIVNITPDSFSDGGKYFSLEEALRRIRNMIDEGADVIDIGAESTRPGSVPISWEEEWSRLEPVLRGLSPSVGTPIPQPEGTVPIPHSPFPIPISIDTYHPETAKRALDLGASIINCVYEKPVPKMFEICAKKGGKLVIPAKSLGTVPIESVPFWIDPMIGFGTSREEDLELLRSIHELTKKGRVLVGASRKRIVKKLTGEKVTGKNLGGNVAIAVWAALQGASMVRVHDVRETVQALRVVSALERPIL